MKIHLNHKTILLRYVFLQVIIDDVRYIVVMDIMVRKKWSNE